VELERFDFVKWKWEAELEERRAERKLREAEFGLKRDEAAKQDTNSFIHLLLNVGKNKILSDAMRSSPIRISSSSS